MHYDLLGSGLGGLFVAWLVWRALQRKKIKTSDWMPRELRASRLAYAERLFRSAGPVSVSARLDRAYRDQAGVVTLVELKTRKADRVYLSDVIELSAQRYALQSQTGERVSEHGYVVVQNVGPRRRKVHRLDDDSFASDLLSAQVTTKRVGKMPAEAWFESVDHDRYEVQEHSVRFAEGIYTVLRLTDDELLVERLSAKRGWSNAE